MENNRFTSNLNLSFSRICIVDIAAIMSYKWQWYKNKKDAISNINQRIMKNRRMRLVSISVIIFAPIDFRDAPYLKNFKRNYIK